MDKRFIKTIEKTCEYCGEIFLTDSSHIYKKYCNWRCRNENFKKQNPIKIKEYKRREKIKHAERYRLINGLYKDRIRYGGNRRKVMERDNFSCVTCKRKYPNVNLVVHHIDENKKNNKLDNLITLCRACHARLHHNFV